MIKLKIDLEEPINAMTFRMEMTGGGWYLDTETGAILLDCDAGDEELPEDLRDNPRYRWIDPIESRDGFTLMEDFIETVADSKVRERLDDALGKSKPFRRFKDTLEDYPAVREAWFRFEHEGHARLARE